MSATGPRTEDDRSRRETTTDQNGLTHHPTDYSEVGFKFLHSTRSPASGYWVLVGQRESVVVVVAVVVVGGRGGVPMYTDCTEIFKSNVLLFPTQPTLSLKSRTGCRARHSRVSSSTRARYHDEYARFRDLQLQLQPATNSPCTNATDRRRIMSFAIGEGL